MKTFTPLEPARAAFLRERAKPYLDETPSLTELRTRLLDQGGLEVVFQPEPHLSALLERGRGFPTRRLRRQFIANNRCHENSATLWYETQGRTKVATGYALATDSLWRQHSWGIENDWVVETTKARRTLVYFGFEMTDREALKLAFENIPDFGVQVQADAVPGSWVGELVKRIVAESNITPSRIS